MTDDYYVGYKEEKALKDYCPVTIVFRQQSTRCFAGGIQDDRVRLSKDEGLPAFFVSYKQEDLSRRVQCEMVNAFVRTTGDVHELGRLR